MTNKDKSKSKREVPVQLIVREGVVTRGLDPLKGPCSLPLSLFCESGCGSGGCYPKVWPGQWQEGEK